MTKEEIEHRLAEVQQAIKLGEYDDFFYSSGRYDRLNSERTDLQKMLLESEEK